MCWADGDGIARPDDDKDDMTMTKPQIKPLTQTQEAFMTITDRDFKTAMGRFLTGVTVVSCIRQDGTAYGLTVNSFASVSLTPRLVLWSLIKDNSSAADFAKADSFSIAILTSDQADICQRFATEHDDRFAGIAWHKGQAGAPIIEGAMSVLECRPWQNHEAGDHIIYIGEVIAIHQTDTPARPMSYFAGKVNEI